MAVIEGFFLVIGLIILIGFFGHILRDRTSIPETLFLLVLGVILGPVSGFFDASDASLLLGFVPILSVFALVVILLEAGTSLDMFSLVRSVPRSLLFTFLTFILTILTITAVLHFLLAYSPEIALIIAIICSGITTVTVIAMVEKLDAPKSARDLLTLESIVNDFAGIVGTFLVLDFIQARNVDVTTASQTLFGDIFAALVAGLLAAVAWREILTRLHIRKELSYMSTLGAAFVVYYLGFVTGANPIITVFIFALFLGNMKELAGFIGLKIGEFSSTLRSLRAVQPDIAFFVRTFFFVMLGIIFKPESLTLSVMAVVVLITAVALVVRFASSTLLSYWDRFFKENRKLLSIMIPRGFAATILAFVPEQYGIVIPYLSDIVLMLVFVSTLVAIIGTSYYARQSEAAHHLSRRKTKRR